MDVIISTKSMGVKSLPLAKLSALLQQSGFSLSTSALSSAINNLGTDVEADETTLYIEKPQALELDEPESEEEDDITNLAVNSANKEMRNHKTRGVL